MRLLGIDLETTGLDFDNDEVTEIAWVLVDTDIEKPLLTESYLLNINGTVSDEITELTGITNGILKEFGVDPKEIYERFLDVIIQHNVGYIVAHNGNGFDKPMLKNAMESCGLDFPKTEWLDTYEDVEFPKTCRFKNLTYLCGEHGFVNPFPHAAMFDTMSMMKLLGMYNINDIIVRHNLPWIVVRAMVSYENRDKAKLKGFMWENVGNKKYPKCWVKKIKENEFEPLSRDCDFEVVQIG
jgi:DNA polymerase-3 subunit epsilon